MNSWLLEQCVQYARVHPHPERRNCPVWDMFEQERSSLVAYAGRFDGFNARTAAVSKTCLVAYDKNKYSVMAQAVGRPVEVHAYAERITIRQDGQIVADHQRCFGREQTVHDPWHYVPVLARKPGAFGSPRRSSSIPGLSRLQLDYSQFSTQSRSRSNVNRQRVLGPSSSPLLPRLTRAMEEVGSLQPQVPGTHDGFVR